MKKKVLKDGTIKLSSNSFSLIVNPDVSDTWVGHFQQYIAREYLSQIRGIKGLSGSEIARGAKQFLKYSIEIYNRGPKDITASPDASLDEVYPNKRKGDDRMPMTKSIPNIFVAEILIGLFGAKCIEFGDTGSSDNCVAGVYLSEGVHAGIYDVSTDGIHSLSRVFKPDLTDKDLSFITDYIKSTAERVMITTDEDLIPVNNGIFNYKTKTLIDFDPSYVFTSKCHVNYDAHAENPIITMPDGELWDVESWMSSLCTDVDTVELLWQGISAAVRPNVDWKKSLWLYAPSGNNGKGTYIQLIRNILGHRAHASITFEDFKEQYMLEPLAHVQANLVDENNTGTYLPNAAKYKAVITHDIIRINRKYEKPIDIRFHGVDIQCVNGFPRVRDDSDSFYRRILPVMFDNRFEGKERTYIKGEYLTDKHPEVLKYVLRRVLSGNGSMSDFYMFSEPSASQRLLGEYKEFNEPVRQFFNEVVLQMVWKLLPWDFLFDTFMQWSVRFNPGGGRISKKSFITQIKIISEEYPGYFFDVVASGDSAGRDKVIRSAGRMDEPEPLILEYNVEQWMNKSYKGADPSKKAMPELKEFYRGLQRDINLINEETDA